MENEVKKTERKDKDKDKQTYVNRIYIYSGIAAAGKDV